MLSNAENDHGRSAWRKVEAYVEMLVPELLWGTFANYGLFERTGGDAEVAVSNMPVFGKTEKNKYARKRGYDREMMRWAGEAFIHQMGFLDFSGEFCCELKKGFEFLPDDLDEEPRRELINKEVSWLVAESMELEGLGIAIPKWMTDCKPSFSVSERLVCMASDAIPRRSRSRSRSPCSCKN